MYKRIDGRPNILSLTKQAKCIRKFCHAVPLDNQFLVDEVEYLLGRLDEEKLEDYIEIERSGRGTIPRVDKTLRRQILDEIVYPYIESKKELKTIRLE